MHRIALWTVENIDARVNSDHYGWPVRAFCQTFNVSDDGIAAMFQHGLPMVRRRGSRYLYMVDLWHWSASVKPQLRERMLRHLEKGLVVKG